MYKSFKFRIYPNKEIIENNKLEQTPIPKSTMIDDIDNEKTEKINLNELSTNKQTNIYDDDTDDDKFFDDFFSDE